MFGAISLRFQVALQKRGPMPEGDTIYRAARALQKALGGKVVTAFETGVAKLASVNDDTPLVDRTVEKVEARGK
jgi:endonuclease-8